MTTLPGSSAMMSPAQLSGSAESGFGISLHGFHCPVIEYPARLLELKSKVPVIRDLVVVEDNGYVTCVVLSRETVFIPKSTELASFRREPHRFFIDLPKFMHSTKAQFVDRLMLSSSMGSITLTLLYRPVELSSDA